MTESGRSFRENFDRPREDSDIPSYAGGDATDWLAGECIMGVDRAHSRFLHRRLSAEERRARQEELQELLGRAREAAMSSNDYARILEALPGASLQTQTSFTPEPAPQPGLFPPIPE